jgi:hypothetical protein
MRRSKISGSLELGLGGAFQVCLALCEEPARKEAAILAAIEML